MLTLHCCNPTGFFSYGINPTINLNEQGLVELTGVNNDRIVTTANGSGKTSLLNTICHLLFGENPSGASDTSIVNSTWSKGAWGYIKFTNGHGRMYRVIMSRKWGDVYPDAAFGNEPSQIHEQNEKYIGTDLYFDEFVNGKWVDLRKTKMVETRHAVVASLGISYDQFLTTSYLAQQRGAQFVSGKNKDRMQIISELLNLYVWDRALKLAKERHDEASKKRVEQNGILLGQLSFMQSLNAPLEPTQVIEYMDQLSILETELQECMAGADKITAVINEDNNKINAARKNISEQEQNIFSLKSKVQVLMSELNKNNTEEFNTVNAIMNSKADCSSLLYDLYKLDMDIKHIYDRMNQFESMNGQCNECESELSIGYVTSKVDNLQEQKTLLLDKKSRVENAISDKNKTFKIEQDSKVEAVHATHEEKRILLKQDIISIEEEIAILTVIKNQMFISISNIEDTNKLHQRTWVEHKEKESTLKIKIGAVNSIIENNEHNINNTEKAELAVNATKDRVEEYTKACSNYEVLIKGFSDRGIKVHKFGSIIERLNTLVDKYIKILTSGQVQVWFSPWRERANSKDASSVVAEIQIFVKEGVKSEVDLTLYSGAERQQITLAIISAFHDLASESGNGTNVLFLDEIFGVFDGPTAGLAISLIDTLRESSRGTIILISHDSRIKDLLDCDQSWVVTKQNHLSIIKTGDTNVA
jgi:DNA repair exonuclease SbcCD ATPase subunit